MHFTVFIVLFFTLAVLLKTRVWFEILGYIWKSAALFLVLCKSTHLSTFFFFFFFLIFIYFIIFYSDSEGPVLSPPPPPPLRLSPSLSLSILIFLPPPTPLPLSLSLHINFSFVDCGLLYASFMNLADILGTGFFLRQKMSTSLKDNDF
jgi:hypothetical protein